MTTKGYFRPTLPKLSVFVSTYWLYDLFIYSLFVKHLLYLSYVLLGVGDIIVNKLQDP